MTNNFSKIRELLEFENENTFYFIQILQRRKENPEMARGVRVIDNFYLYSVEDLDKLEPKIIEACTKYNARAYIKLNRLDLEKVALYCQKKTIDLLIQGEYKAVKNVYPTVCGKFSDAGKDKKWIVDIDEDELEYKDKIVEIINDIHSKVTKKNYKIVAELPTKSGIHIITNPFNVKEFNDRLEELGVKIEVKKNNPTILFCL